ncbi:MAG: TIGR03032 family protein [Thermonemataceae bacterium]|nr:TIGR03032 family protein [Thermonemataceae bacterium]
MSNKPFPPFTCTYSPNIPEFLWQLNASIVLSTYQAGKMVFLSAANKENLIQLPRNFKKAMGIALKDNYLAIATESSVIVFAHDRTLAPRYPLKPNTYETLFVPRATYYTGILDLHDLEWGNEGLWAVNTQFSCLSLINDQYSFQPKWQPHFISKLEPGDRCHLNGLAMQNGKPKYVTALGTTDEPMKWRENKVKGGVLIDVDTNEFVAQELGMPHTPKIYKNKVLVLESATGSLTEIDPQTGKKEMLYKFPGFVRGLSIYEDYAFVGLSKIRTSSKTFSDLPISKESLFSGVAIMYLPHRSIVGYVRYEASVEEIYSVQVLPNVRRAGMVSMDKDDHNYCIVTPTETFWAVRNDEHTTLPNKQQDGGINFSYSN